VSDKGRFVWYDLMANDQARSLEFYTELFGWKTQQVEMGSMGTYTFIEAGGRRNGGTVRLDPAQKIPSHWLSYLTVDDVDDLVSKAPEMSAHVLYPPTDIPDVGRFAVIADPTGAVFAPFKGTEPPPVFDDPPPAGAFCWSELLTHDTAKAAEFYVKVCGWGTQEVDMGDAGVYTLFKRGETEAGGMMQMPPNADAPSNWLLYVMVEDVDATAKRIAELGGSLFVQPREIPDVGRFAVAADPDGAVFALFKSLKS
jgi:predicted enzyme related to lactoylglutathione lyase